MQFMSIFLRAALTVCVAVFGNGVIAADPAPDLLAGGLGQHWETTGNWSLKHGVAVLTPRPGEKGWSRWTAYLWSKEKYKDFEIEFD